MTDDMDTSVSLTSHSRKSGPSGPLLSRSDLQILLQETDVAAARLVRRLRLPAHEREDVRQDLLTDLIARFPAFDPARGTLGAFAGTVIAHRAARMAARIRRDRVVFAQVSLDDPVAGAEDITLGDAITESGSYAALMGQCTDRFAAVERRLDLDRALGTLRGSDMALCARLIHRTPTELSQDGLGSRASLYRQVHEIRLRLMTGGLSDAA
jgi:RNA polymerase sigma-70 factor (ECF subfamily)